MAVILTFFVSHWVLSIFFQTFYLHRYSSHRMFTMSRGWERFFHFMTWLSQGSSYLKPKGYAILHREHHAFSDTERDPHSPHTSNGFGDMMYKTATRYNALFHGTVEPESRFLGGYPEWPALERFADRWIVRLGFGAAYASVYFIFAPHWAFYAMIPLHWLMGPMHGGIVNWFGHKVGYRNFETTDKSKNSLPFDFVTMGELFQNNHHKFGQAPNFAARWFEIDPAWQVIRVFGWLGIIKFTSAQTVRTPDVNTVKLTDTVAVAELPSPEMEPALGGE